MIRGGPVQRALGYPYPRPTSSFIFINGHAYTFDSSIWKGCHDCGELRVRKWDIPDAPAADTSLLSVQTNNNADSVVCAQQAGLEHGVNLQQYVRQQEWVPVLAMGSNASPQQLIRKCRKKYDHDGVKHEDVIIPVVSCVLENFDVVYAPYLSSYGACPATLDVSPGTCVSVFITFLPRQLAEAMHKTEVPAYALVRLKNIRLHVASSLGHLADSSRGPSALQGTSTPSAHHGPTTGQHENRVHSEDVHAGPGVWTSVLCYQFVKGSLALPLGSDGASSPVALAEIPAYGRRFPAWTQPGVQTALMQLIEGNAAGSQTTGRTTNRAGAGHAQPTKVSPKLKAWVKRIINDLDFRSGARHWLQTHAAVGFDYPHAELCTA